MSTDPETTRITRSWLEDGADRIPDRVLDAVEARLGETRQRRAGWLARGLPVMNSTAMRLGVAAAAILAAAIIGIGFLPGNVGGPPPPNPTATATPTPIPTPVALAAGRFWAVFGTTEINATGGGAEVSGSLEVSTEGRGFTADLQCARTTDAGLRVIGGDITRSTHDEAQTGTRVAILFEPATPVRTILWFEDPRPAVNCLAFLEGLPANAGDFLEPIAGDVELAP